MTDRLSPEATSGAPVRSATNPSSVAPPTGSVEDLEVVVEEGKLTDLRDGQLGWKFMSCSHCQELGQQAGWLLIGYIRVKTTDKK